MNWGTGPGGALEYESDVPVPTGVPVAIFVKFSGESKKIGVILCGNRYNWVSLSVKITFWAKCCHFKAK